MSGTDADYFTNHARKLRFPWSLYHRPLVRAVAQALSNSPGPRVLNVGCGPFSELSLLPGHLDFSVCDIDPRAVEVAQRTHGERLSEAKVLEAGAALPWPGESFDAVLACDVVEHLLDPLAWSCNLVRVLRPGGLMVLTTPNYGSRSLVAIETTVLELIARRQGFSRRAIHPSKFEASTLRALLVNSGLERIAVERTSFAWVLLSRAYRPEAPRA